MNIPSRVIGVVDKYKVVDIFPYKIKNLKKFIFRDHVPYVQGDEESKLYARETTARCVEGHWVYDCPDGSEVGTWVYMMPKLYFFANLGTVIAGEGKTRKPQPPGVTDIEWIIFTYILCVDGFSGFQDDPKYTCNIKVKYIQEGREYPPKVMQSLEKYCKTPEGEWKEYINAWDYLTYAYLLGDPRPYSLGLPLYENDTYNGMILATRGGRKSYSLSAGDCMHELWTDGAMYVEDLKGKPQVAMFLGSVDTEYIDNFLKIGETCFTNIPGVGHGNHYWFTKTTTPNWDTKRGHIERSIRIDDGTYVGSGSYLAKAVIQTNKAEIVVAKRTKRIYIDECGLQGNLLQVYEASAATLKSPSGKFGALMLTGTGGNIEKIGDSKEMYNNPKTYDIFPIPNYWYDGKDQGLFIPASYKWDIFKDENGNTIDLIAATKYVIEERVRLSEGDISKQTGSRMNEPLEPSEIFLSGTGDYFDKDILIDRIEVVEKHLFDTVTKYYDLQLGRRLDVGYDVIAKQVFGKRHEVLSDPFMDAGRRGRLAVFEPPMGDGREFLPFDNLYKVVLDPKTDSLTGKSYYKIIVWKGHPRRTLEPNEMYNTIVAEAKIKEDGLLTFMLLCLWYKSRGQYERNVNGIPDFFDKYGLRGLLQPTPLAYIKDVTPGSKQVVQTGIFMNDDLKIEALKLLGKLHKTVVHKDEDGVMLRAADTWFDLSLLYEMNYYNDEGNFDSVSAMLILCIWLQSEYIPEGAQTDSNKEEDTSWEDLASTASRILR